MSVLIKDMEMPKSCDSCDLLQDYDGDMYCPLNSYLNFGDIENVPDYVMDSCPLSEVPERKKGEWDFMGWQMFQCSECKHTFTQDFLEGWREYTYEPFFPPFCPNCGADMRGEQNENN